jgi:hypothetical protein
LCLQQQRRGTTSRANMVDQVRQDLGVLEL